MSTTTSKTRSSEPAPRPRTWRERIDPVVLGAAAIASIIFVIWGWQATENLKTTSASASGWVIENTGWFFVLVSSMFVVFVIFLPASKFGRIRLGRDDERPEFKTVSWIAMMFSAGMGIGLMFWGVAEPLTHYAAPPPGGGAPQSDEAIRTAMATTMFHWSLHPWAIYAVVGIAIAYGTFRRGRKQLISSAFIPLFGKRAEGPAGKIIDILAIFATLFGSAASLGLGAIQIGEGLAAKNLVESSDPNDPSSPISVVVLVSIVVVLTILFIASAVSGIARGIQWLSNINMVLALALALFVFVVGPTLLILNLIPTVVGEYIAQLPQMASRTSASGGSAMQEWLSSWTIFYWAWWVAWTPFVGMFIARISRGRTIREFVAGVLLVPSLVSLAWFCIFGGAGIFEQREKGGFVAADGTVDDGKALFQLLGDYPLTTLTTVLVIVLVGIFFVSGADAASIVMGTLSERGDVEPSKPSVILWGTLTGAVAAIMLLVGGGGSSALDGLQGLTIVAALPFVVVIVFLCVSLYRDLQTDPLIVRYKLGVDAVEDAVTTGVKVHDGDFALVVEAADHHDAEPAPKPSHDAASSNGQTPSSTGS